MDELEKALEERIEKCGKRNHANYFVAYALLVLAVLASAGAAYAVASEEFPKKLIAILAAVPGTFILVSTTFRFEERSRRYWRKRTKLQVLCRRYRFEGMPTAEVSQCWNKIDEEMFDEWPGFGFVPLHGKKGSA
ncbi:MAG: hypothetical protein JWQ21_431 [Herminiimonas sp.]|nr:hypothetical protein [Herminiimonas sp.]